MKNPTIPKEPKFHIPHHKKIKCLTLNEMRSYSSCFNWEFRWLFLMRMLMIPEVICLC